MALTDAEKERIRSHLGYSNVSTEQTYSLGVPENQEVAFILEDHMANLLPVAEPHVRRCIQECDCIEDDLSRARATLVVTAVGSTRFGGADTMDELERQYSQWVRKLSDAVASPINPYSNAHGALNTVAGNHVIEPR